MGFVEDICDHSMQMASAQVVFLCTGGCAHTGLQLPLFWSLHHNVL